MHGSRVRIGVAASIAGLAVLAGNAFATAGDLDTSFGVGGKQTVNFGNDDSGPVDLALQPDGKIVMVGTTHDPAGSLIVLCRLLPNGTLDPSFGASGQESFKYGASSSGTAVAIAPDGHIFVGGSGGTGAAAFVFSRRNADANPDSTFGSSGISLIQFSGGGGFLRDLALQSDGKVVGVGMYAPSQGNQDFAVGRLKQNGTFDDSFGNNGRETIGFGADDGAYSVLIQPDQKIVVSGVGTTLADFVATRLTTSGAIDGSFGTGGSTQVDFGQHYDTVYASAIQPDGKIVLVGATATSVGSDMAIARLRTDGALDPTFSDDGKTTVDLGGTKDAASSVVIQADGKILLGGFGGPNNDLLLTRLNADGTPDTTFAPGGSVAIDFNGTETGGVIGLQPDGARVIGGATSVNGDFAVARVVADGTPGSTPAPIPDPTDPTVPTGPSGPAGIQCAGKTVTVIGTDQRDKLQGTPGDDVISTLGGNDKVKGGDGDDVICSGDGNDKVFGGAGADRLLGGGGRDRLQGGGGPDTLKGGIGDDVLNGGGGQNSLHGGPGHDQQKP